MGTGGKYFFHGIALLFTFVFFSRAGHTATFTVANTNDSGFGSLRQAILDANALPGLDNIDFNISGAGPHTITPAIALPAITSPVILDGTTQPGFIDRPIVELDGTMAGLNVDGLVITAGTSTIRGLIINRFNRDGIVLKTNGGNVVESCFLGTDSTGMLDLGNGRGGLVISNVSNNRIGGATSAARNLISGNDLSGISLDGAGATGNEIQGNFIGTDITGVVALGNGGSASTVAGNWRAVHLNNYASNNTIGGTVPGAGNVISGNLGNGIFINGGSENKIQGNFIGTNRDGTASLPNHIAGIQVYSGSNNTIGGLVIEARNIISGNGVGISISGASVASEGNVVLGNFIGTNAQGTISLGNLDGVRISVNATNNTIGGTTPEARNVISGNTQYGIRLEGSGVAGNDVSGNFIGLGADGTSPLGNTSHGVFIAGSASNNCIGGADIDAGNTIAFNGGCGISVLNGIANVILSNAIFSNDSLGIDLGLNGVTPNDPGDVDIGANTMQNFPVLTLATSGSITGTLNSTSNTVFILQFFANTACDTSGYGEGKNLVGSTTVTTDSNGECNFTATLSVPMAHGQSLTATATDSSGNTSEFSLCLDITDNIKPVADGGPDQTVNEGTLVTLDGSGSTNPNGNTLTYQWIQIAGTSVSLNLTDPVYPTFVTPDVPIGGSVLTFQLIVSDGELSSDPDVVDITVKNINNSPVADAGLDQTVEQASISGAEVTLDGTGSSDPDNDTLTYTWTGPFGTATGPTPAVTMPPGINTVYLVVNDGTVDSAPDTVTITVQDTTAPVVSNTTANPNPVAVNTECTITAQIDDTSSNISYAEYSLDGIQWYNMDPITTGTNSVNVSVTMPGVTESKLLTVSVRGTDEEGNTSEAESIYLPVYDPSAGFVTGGGWIWSPKGAYMADTTLEGKANFGFVAKYKKGANIPDGSTEFKFTTGNLNFHSNVYDWLVVAGYKAMFKGTGTINGEGSYKFMISCVDGDLKGNGAKDTFRIRIWDEDGNGGETTIYDNQMGADMDAEATTTLGGGSIIIHKGK